MKDIGGEIEFVGLDFPGDDQWRRFGLYIGSTKIMTRISRSVT
jgi:hypothetical protein